MLFINTRPKDRAMPLTQAMQAKGLTVLNLPLLELVPIAISAEEQNYQHTFTHQSQHFDSANSRCQQASYKRISKPNTNNNTQINANTEAYKALIVISPTAAEMGLANCPPDFKPSCTVIAVGHRTATVLREAGWQVQCPDEYSNEGMMRMPALSELGEGDRVLIWRGKGGRRLLVNHLQDKNIHVEAIEWYLRQCPKDALQNFISIQDSLANVSECDPLPESSTTKPNTTKPIVLVSSGEAFNNWQALLNTPHADSKDSVLKDSAKQDVRSFKLSDFHYLTFGKRLTDRLTHLHLSCIRIEHLDVAEVWRGIERINSI